MQLSTDHQENGIKRACLFILFLLAAIQLFIVIANHYFLRTYTFDYGVYNFAFFDYAHLKVSPCPVYLSLYPVTFLQDHFSLTLLFFAPLYWLLGGILGTYTLLFIQWSIVIFGAWATYRLILLKTGRFTLSFLAALYYFSLLGRFSAANGDCNLAIIGSALVPVFVYYFESRKLIPALICFLFLIFNREDYPLWLFFISVFLAIVHRKDSSKFKMSLGFLFLSLLCFIFIFQVVIPGLEDENKKYSLFNFAALGKTPSSSLLFIVRHPVRALELLFINHSGNPYYDDVKKEFYWVYFLSGGFLLLFRPVYLIPFVPLIAKKMYNDEPVRWGIESFYSVEVVSLLPLMVFLIIAQFDPARLKLPLAGIVCGFTLIVTIFEFNAMKDVKKFNFLTDTFYKADYDLKEIKEAMLLIPDTAAVSASGKLAPHIAFRKKIYYFPRVADAQYVLVIKKDDNWPISQEEADRLMNELITQKGWEILSEKKDFRLLRKKENL